MSRGCWRAGEFKSKQTVGTYRGGAFGGRHKLEPLPIFASIAGQCYSERLTRSVNKVNNALINSQAL